MTTATTPKPVVCPFTVAVDTREQLPYSFTGIIADSDRGYRPLTVPTQQKTIYQGDYSIVGLENEISIERKSLSDLYSSCGVDRERFKKEHERLSSYKHAVVIVEATIHTVLFHRPEYSKLDPKNINRISIRWPIRYGVHWRFVGIDRQDAMSAITNRGLTEVAKEVDVAFFKEESHAERVEKVIEAYRAQHSRMLSEQVTFRILEAYWNLKIEAEKERKKDERSKHAENSRSGRGKRIGDHGGNGGASGSLGGGWERHFAGPPSGDDAPF